MYFWKLNNIVASYHLHTIGLCVCLQTIIIFVISLSYVIIFDPAMGSDRYVIALMATSLLSFFEQRTGDYRLSPNQNPNPYKAYTYKSQTRTWVFYDRDRVYDRRHSRLCYRIGNICPQSGPRSN